ncbi:DEAD/DEAH box helicase [Lacihabitans sp. LS3-19]|uniref:DEAD/DEAH box helicase n=1 Tax=Lacihabitans sp. LS3-19 TaxID=2487335 RepID=UPI0020CDAA18|nr:DEAD/DEAH box helicase [Lacihabitans sp. LS3-19]MCP9770049.1 DEAD/DEAH box helicase [Lacihabitans sp. LS3-19]
MSFENLGLSSPILKAVKEKGYITPSPIQEKAIPLVLDRKDILASAQTGTGKTAGFTLPILQILSTTPNQGRRKIRSLILTPTRELAAQIYENIKEYSVYLDIKATVVFGGVNINPQISTLKNGIDILVATPGRLLDLHGQRALSLANVEILVLDEADRMLDMGFAKDIKRVLALVPERRQNLLFSATFSLEIKQLAAGILHNPEMVEASPENTTVEKIEQRVILADKNRKPSMLVKMIKEDNWDQVLVFTRTKHGANKLTEKLQKSDITSAAIHGNKSQGARTKALDDFKKNEIQVLVATDIAARGLDIPLLPHVVNYELPNVPEDYVHRIGRTGRAGASGEAVSFVCSEEYDFLRGIEKLLGQKFERETMLGYEPTEEESIAPSKAEHRRPNNNFRKPNPQSGGGRSPHSGGGSSTSDSKKPKRFFGKR